MSDLISPKYQMSLVSKVVEAIWNEYGGYTKVRYYVEKWQVWNYNYPPNFSIITKNNSDNIDLEATINNLDGEILLKMAIDLGIETPDFIPSIPTFRNEIKSSYQTASATFEKAFKLIESDPSVAVGLANSALESIIKEIMADERISTKISKKDTLYDLTSDILKEFSLFPNSDMPSEIKTIGSSLLASCQAIERMRSEKTELHGKTKDDYIIKDPLYAYFVVNVLTTLGLFLNSFYKKKYPVVVNITSDNYDDSLPF